MTLKELETVLLNYRADYTSSKDSYPKEVEVVDRILDNLQRLMSVDKEWLKGRVKSFFYCNARRFQEADSNVQRVGNVDFQFFVRTFVNQRTGMQLIANDLRDYVNAHVGISFGNFVSVDVYVDQIWVVFADRLTVKVNLFESDDILVGDEE